MDVSQGFFGLKLKPGEQLSSLTEQPFRITMAALGQVKDPSDRCCVKLKHEKAEYVLCSLIPGKCEQQLLNLAFVEGEKLTFSITGKNEVFLSGYLLDENRFIDSDSDSDSSDYDDDPSYRDIDDEDDEDEEDDEDYEEEDEDDEEDDEEEDEDGEDTPKIEEIDDDTPVPADGFSRVIPIVSYDEQQGASDAAGSSSPKKNKHAKDAGKSPSSKVELTPRPPQQKPGQKRPNDGTPLNEKAQRPKTEHQPQTPSSSSAASTSSPTAAKTPNSNKQEGKPKKFTMKDGLQVEEVQAGAGGKKAKKGDRVKVQYVGKLPSGKVFDKGSIAFALGKGEVIQGWDMGVEGMAVGGKRRLVIPPKLAYGPKGSGPIPPNATLHFEVTLEKVN